MSTDQTTASDDINQMIQSAKRSLGFPPRRVFLVVDPRGGPPWAGTDEARAHEYARNTGQVVAELSVAADYSAEDTR